MSAYGCADDTGLLSRTQKHKESTVQESARDLTNLVKEAGLEILYAEILITAVNENTKM
jgi:hypothetical protein